MFINGALTKSVKFLKIFGLEYSVLWSVIIYFLWDDGPFIFTLMDVIAGLFVIYAGYRIFKDKAVVNNTHYLLAFFLFISLLYNSIWTLVIMLFLEVDMAFGLPLDLISLTATSAVAYEVWDAVFITYLRERG